MNVASINVKDFGPIENAEVVFDEPLCVIQGKHKQGKTTLINAVRLSLTPRCPNTDKKGGGAMDNVQLGTKKAEITLNALTKQGPVELFTTYGPGATRRGQKVTMNGAVAYTEKPGEKKNPATVFAEYLERNTEAISCVLDSDYFFNPKTEQKDILAALILPSSHEFPAETMALAEKHLGKFVWDKSPVSVIDQVYQTAYSARRDAKAALGGIFIPSQPQRPEYPAETVQEKIAHYRALAQKESKKIKGGGTVQIGRIEQSIEQEKTKLETARADYSAAIQRRGEIDQAMLDQPNVKKAERTAAGRKLWAQLQAQIMEFDQEIAGQQDAQAVYQELLQDENGSPVDHANCPTCTQLITRESVNEKIAIHQKLIDAAEEAKLNLVAEQNGLGDIVGAEKTVADHAAWTAKKLQVVKDVADATGRITMFEKSLADLEASLVTAKAQEAAPVDTAAFDAAQAELAEWEARLSPALNYESTLLQIEQAQTRQQDQKAKVADLETLVAYFGDNGVKADLIAQGAATFMATVNGVLSKWGYEAKLSPEADSFTVLVPKGWVPTKQLSGFELLMFKIALQCAIAVHSKLKIVAIDEAQVMIDDERKTLFRTLDGMCKDKLLDKAFLILADAREVVPSRAGMAYYRVEAGKVVRL
jgi:DNA repair exonuclease SbcCD ATPase subunit